MLLLAHVLWLVERHDNPRFRKKYFAAIGEGLWGSMLIIATGEHGDRDAPNVLKRIAVVAMWLLGVILIAQLTATVTSSQIVARFQSEIRGPADLPGKKMAAKRGKGMLQVVGPIFKPYKIGFVVREGSPLRKQINEALLAIYADGTYEDIYAKWFARPN